MAFAISEVFKMTASSDSRLKMGVGLYLKYSNVAPPESAPGMGGLVVLCRQEVFHCVSQLMCRRELFTAESDWNVQTVIVMIGPWTFLLLDLVWKLRK